MSSLRPSGAKRRQQMKIERHARASAQATSHGNGNFQGAEIGDAETHSFRLFKGADSKDLRTVFHVREAEFEVQARIKQSLLPLARCLGKPTVETPYYREVVALPLRPPWEKGQRWQEEVIVEEEDDEETVARKAEEFRKEMERREQYGEFDEDGPGPSKDIEEGEGSKVRKVYLTYEQVERRYYEQYLDTIYNKYPPSRLNHFEHNLKVWKELWRVCEFCDVLVLTVDSRNPLFHLPPALYSYVAEVQRKPFLIVFNKVDLITSNQLKAWEAYFAKQFPGVTIVPFSSFPYEHSATMQEDAFSRERKQRHRKIRPGGHDHAPHGVEALSQLLNSFLEGARVQAKAAKEEERKQREEREERGKKKLEEARKEMSPQELARSLLKEQNKNLRLERQRMEAAEEQRLQLQIQWREQQAQENARLARAAKKQKQDGGKGRRRRKGKGANKAGGDERDASESPTRFDSAVKGTEEKEERGERVVVMNPLAEGSAESGWDNAPATGAGAGAGGGGRRKGKRKGGRRAVKNQTKRERDGEGKEEEEGRGGGAGATKVSPGVGGGGAMVEKSDGKGGERVGGGEGEDGAGPLEGILKVGFVGHPNTGKSSLINALMKRQAVSVSSTPGHTKHIQSLLLPANKEIELLDCPGLVFPALDMPRPLQVLCMVFPIDQLVEPYSVVQYLAERVPLEKVYNLTPVATEESEAATLVMGEDELELLALGGDAMMDRQRGKGRKGRSRKGGGKGKGKSGKGGGKGEAEGHMWSAWGICEAFAQARKYKTAGGLDTRRAAIEILQETLQGQVPLVFSPPSYSRDGIL